MPGLHRFAPALRAFAAPAVLFATALACVAAPACGGTLTAGDLVIVNAYEWDASQSVLRVVDHTNGILKIDPATGVQSVFVARTALGGAGPTGIAREESGNFVVVCGDANGIWRVSPAGAVLGVFSAHAAITYANAIAVAPNGTLWVADGNQQVVAVDPVLGTQTPLNVTGVSFSTPVAIAIGKGGSPLYVNMYGYFTYHQTGGAWMIDPASGAGARVEQTFQWVDGVAVDPVSGNAYVSTVDVINHDTPYYAHIAKGVQGAWSILGPEQHLSGVLAVVPPQFAAPAVPTTWGRFKAMMR